MRGKHGEVPGERSRVREASGIAARGRKEATDMDRRGSMSVRPVDVVQFANAQKNGIEGLFALAGQVELFHSDEPAEGGPPSPLSGAACQRGHKAHDPREDEEAKIPHHALVFPPKNRKGLTPVKAKVMRPSFNGMDYNELSLRTTLFIIRLRPSCRIRPPVSLMTLTRSELPTDPQGVWMRPPEALNFFW